MCNKISKYIIGVDTYNFDNKESAICVFDQSNGSIAYLKGCFSEQEFNKELERVCKYYSVPLHEVIKEENKKTKIRTNEIY